MNNYDNFYLLPANEALKIKSKTGHLCVKRWANQVIVGTP